MRQRPIKALIPALAVLASVPALAQTAVDRPEYWHHAWDWGSGHMIVGTLMMILFWGGIIVLIVLGVRWLGGGPWRGAELPSSRKTAFDILQERFARGEIDKKEFEERKRTLSG